MEVSTRETAEILPKSNALCLIEEGLSFPTTCAPRTYCKAVEHSSAAIHEYELGIEAFIYALEPQWGERHHGSGSTIQEGCSNNNCTVDKRTTRFNEAHMILPSQVDGAGLGLFSIPLCPVRLQQCPCTAPSAIMLDEMSMTSRTW